MNLIFKSCLLAALAIFIFAAEWRAAAQSATGVVSPSPWGEGRGEGDRDNRKPASLSENIRSYRADGPAIILATTSVPTISAAPAPAPKPSASYNAVNLRQRPYLLALIVLLLVIGLVYVLVRRRQPA